MKSFQQNRFLYTAIGISLLAHGVLLAVRFVAPPPNPVKPTDPGLEVILVNAKHKNAPLKAEALAQANLDGGGTVDQGRSKSPLPDMRKMETGDSIQATQRRIASLEEQQRNLLNQVKRKNPFNVPKVTEDARVLSLAEQLGATPSQIGLAWLLRQSDVVLLIPGTSSVAHLDENVASGRIVLSDTEIAELEGPLAAE